MPFTLNVNGKTTTVDVPADMPLLWVLRDVLNLKGTKFGCGIGQCGACTVHVERTRRASCQTPVSQAAGARSRPSKVCRRTARIRCSRRGRRSTCRSAATARPARSCRRRRCSRRTPVPTDAEINTAMNGNLCRCGTYLRIREAIHRAASLTDSALDVDGAGRRRTSKEEP